MKRATQKLDAVRNVKRQWVSYLSIVVIAMLAVMAYLGIHFASRAIANSGNAFYDETHFRDVEIISTKLLTKDDLDAIRATEGVADVESVWYTTGKLRSGEDCSSVNIVSLTRRVNVPVLQEGRLPETADECALEQTIAEELGLQPGDTVSLQSPKGETAEYLGRSEFTITGIVFHPDHGCFPLQVPGSREVVVLPEAFELGEDLRGCCMKAELLLDKTAGVDRFGKRYLASVQTVMESLETLSAERTALRDAEIRAMYAEQIDEGQTEVDEAAEKLSDARKQLDDGAAEIAENQKKLDDAARTLEDSLRLLEEGAIELDEARTVLEQTKWQLNNAAMQLADGKSRLDEVKTQLDDAECQLADGKAILDEKKAELDDARRQLDDAKQQLIDGKAKLDQSTVELENARIQLEDAEKQLEDGKNQLTEGEGALFAGANALADGERQLADARTQIAAGEQELAAAETTLTTSYIEIENKKADVRNQIKDTLKNRIQDAYAVDDDTKARLEQAVDMLPWAESDTAPDLNDPTLHASEFQLLPGVGIELSHTSEELIDAVMARFHAIYDAALDLAQSLGVSEETAAALEERRDDVSAAVRDALNVLPMISEYDDTVRALNAWDDGFGEYQDGRARLEDAKAQYAAGLAEYEEGKRMLAAGEYAYEEGRKKYEAGLAEYEEGKAKYEAGLEEYEAGKARYEAGLAEYEDGEAQYADGLAKYNDGEAQYEEKLAEFHDGKAQYEDGLAQYLSAKEQYDSAFAKYQSGLITYLNGLAEYDDGAAAYEDGLQQYNDGKKQLAEGRETLREKEAEYADGRDRLAEGRERLDFARLDMESQDPARWVILNAEGNPSYIAVRNGTRHVGDMGATFALVFVLVGALVIYATVGRIVDEQRRLVGAEKANGFLNREIVDKYLIFGVSGAVLGVILGTLLGYIGIQPILTMVYGRYYVFGIKHLAFIPGLAGVALLLGIALTGVTVWLSCTELLRGTAIHLMQEKAPPSKFRSRGNRKLPLYWRAALLNMRMDKKRIAVTIVSVAGCCTLLVAGFSMRSSVMDSLDRQFDEAAVYDAKITWEPDSNPEAGAKIEETLRGAGADWVALYDRNQVWAVNGTLKSAELLCAPLAELDHYFARRDPKTGKPLDGADGVWVNKPVSDKLNVKAGDEIILYDAVMNPYPARVAGVFNEYAGLEMILSPEYYTEVFGASPKNNAFLLHWGGTDIETLRAQLAAIPGFGAMEEIAALRATYQSFAGVLNLIAGVLTLVAALMAYFILLNLANMYVNQKKRELTIMRVNGFTVKEVIRYVAGESIATTAIGIALGLALGTLLAGRVLSLMEDETLQFIHTVQWSGWLFGALITVVFSVVIYALALRKVKDLKLTDVA